MRLFTEEYDTYNGDAKTLDSEASKIIRPLFKKYIEKGYNPRDISHILSAVVGIEECEFILTRNAKKALAKREGKRK